MEKYYFNGKIEDLIIKTKSGNFPIYDFLKILMDSNLALPSGSEVMKNGEGFRPLIFQKENTQMIACFTDLEKSKKYSQQAPFCLVIKGMDLMKRIPENFGLVINPGFTNGMDFTPDGIKKIVTDFEK